MAMKSHAPERERPDIEAAGESPARPATYSVPRLAEDADADLETLHFMIGG